MRSLVFLTAVSAVALAAGSARADLVTGPSSTDPFAAPNTPTGDTYGVRFRSFNNTGGQEMYLGKNDLGVAGNRVGQDFTYGSSQSFSFSYNGTNVTSTLGGGTPLTFATGGEAFNALRIAVINRDAGSASLSGLTLNGNPISGTFTGGTTTSYYLITGFGPGPINLTGTINRTGVFTNSQENARIEITAAVQSVPEPATVLMMLTGLPACGLVARVGRRFAGLA